VPRETKNLELLERTLGYQFNDKSFLRLALTHSSLAHELESRAVANGDSQASASAQQFGDNEQLEFLGDAVLGFVTSRLLFEKFPDFKEGQLSKLRAHLVSARYLIKVARHLQLGIFLLLGRGEERSGGRSKPALLVDALEATIAAIFLDGGMDPARNFVIETILQPELDRLGDDLERGVTVTDYKSALQELLQARGMGQPSYVLVSEAGPEHQKLFTLEVRINPNGAGPQYVSRAEGTTKKKAEQKAAQQALEHLQGEHEGTLAGSN
jgi:ribonuclease III